MIMSTMPIDNSLLTMAIAGVTLLVLLSGLTAALINQDTASVLRRLAEHDHLTGLPNRGFISRMIDGSIAAGSELRLRFVFR